MMNILVALVIVNSCMLVIVTRLIGRHADIAEIEVERQRGWDLATRP